MSINKSGVAIIVPVEETRVNYNLVTMFDEKSTVPRVMSIFESNFRVFFFEFHQATTGVSLAIEQPNQTRAAITVFEFKTGCSTVDACVSRHYSFIFEY